MNKLQIIILIFQFIMMWTPYGLSDMEKSSSVEQSLLLSKHGKLDRLTIRSMKWSVRWFIAWSFMLFKDRAF